MDTLPKTKLTVDNITLRNGDTVQTPDGAGTIFELDIFSARAVGVRLASGELVWFAFGAVTPKKETFDGHADGRP